VTKYGKTLQEKNGLKLVEVVNVEADESVSVLGYAILDPEGNEISRFPALEGVVEAFEELTDDYPPPKPGGSDGPSFG